MTATHTAANTSTPPIDATKQYAGYYAHQPSGLDLTKYRAYDPNTARWLARDSLKNAEMREGPNLYDYVRNDPIRSTDRLGLCPCGQHLELDTEAFSETWETMNGGQAVDYLSASAFSLAQTSEGTQAAIGSAMSEVGMSENVAPFIFDAAEVADPALTLYGVGVALGDFVGSLRCVDDASDPLNNPQNPTDGATIYAYNTIAYNASGL